MRTAVLLGLVMACRSSPPPPNGPPLVVPTVTDASAVVKTFNTPPLLVIVDRGGAVRIALPPRTWAQLATASPTGKAIEITDLGWLMGQAIAEDWSSEKTYTNARVKQTSDAGVDEDPPPEEPDEDEDDDGPGDGAPPSGDLRQEQIAAAGGFGTYEPSSTGFPAFPRTSLRVPTRLSEITGEVKATRALDPKVKALVMIDPQGKAMHLRSAIGHTRGAIAVRLDGEVTALRTQFVTMRSERRRAPWIELRVLGPDKFELEAPPDVPVTVTERAALAAAITGLREKYRLHPFNPVDVLFGPDLDAQFLIDVIVALDAADVHAIGLGPLPEGRQAELRGKLIRRVDLKIYAQGDLDKAPVRELVRASAIVPCYETALTSDPRLRGTLNIQFFVAPDASIKGASAQGVDPALAKCVTDAIEQLKPGKPKGGGGAQFNIVAQLAPKL